MTVQTIHSEDDDTNDKDEPVVTLDEDDMKLVNIIGNLVGVR